MALLDSFTTIGGKNPVLFEEEISLLNENYIESDLTLCNILKDYMLDKMMANNSDTINSGFYKVKYRETNDYVNYILKEKIMYICSSKKIDSSFPSNNIEIYFVNNDGNLISYKDNQIHNNNLDLIAGERDVISIISSMLNGLMISDLERKNKAFIYEINSQDDFNNTFLNSTWSPAIGSSVKFNCSVEANEQNVVIPNNICKIEGNNNIISKIKSFGYANKYKLFNNTYYGGLCINNLTLKDFDDNNNMSNPFKGFVNCIYLYNCSVFYHYGHAYYANPRTGYYNCDNLINCKVDFASGGGGSLGLHNSCFGYSNCTNLINCTSRSKSSTAYYLESETEKINKQDIYANFYKCKNLINCISFDLSVAFGECDNLYNCVIDSNYSSVSVFNRNFIYCHNCYNCYNKGNISSANITSYNNYSIFVNCENLNNCYYTNSTVYNGLINIFKDCDILKDCTGKMLNCTNVFNTKEVLKNQVTYKGPMSIDSDFTKEWHTGENVNFGDTYLLYGGDGISSLKTYNNVNKGYSVKATDNFGDIISIIDVYDSSTQSFEFYINDEMYIPIINNCKEIITFNNMYDTIYMCTVYKDNNGSLRIKIYDNINQTYLTSLNSFDDNIDNYIFMIDTIISSDDKIIWREPGFWDVMSARTGFVTTI